MPTEKSHLFARMHLSFVEEGLLAAINEEVGPGAVIALIVIVSHMNREGVAYPSQQVIAKMAGVTDRTAGTWVRRLLAFRWKGKPIITVEKRENGKGHSPSSYLQFLTEMQQKRLQPIEPGALSFYNAASYSFTRR